MPCSISVQEEEYWRSLEKNKQNQYLTDEINRLTALLCEACGYLENYNLMDSQRLHDWWLKHKKADSMRL
jgi:hypothetical protein